MRNWASRGRQTVAVDEKVHCANYLLGETGLTLPGPHRPSARLSAWLDGEDIPDKAKEVLGTQLRFAEAAGLIRTRLKHENSCGVRGVWILARTTSGLASLVVCEAGSSIEAQLHHGVALAKEQASRYFAGQAMLLVQSQSSSDNMAEFVRFSAIHGEPGPVSDRVYSMQTANDIGVSYAWLGPLG